MVKRLTVIMAAVLLIGSMTMAASGKSSGGMGIGIIAGDPTGLTIKTQPFKIDLAWALGDKGYIVANVDYQLATSSLGNNLNWYYGVGGKIGVGDSFHLGARIPVGIEYKLSGTPFDIFGEVAPGLGLLPGVGLDVDGAIGVRYYF